MQFVLKDQIGRLSRVQAKQTVDLLTPDDLRVLVNCADQQSRERPIYVFVHGPDRKRSFGIEQEAFFVLASNVNCASLFHHAPRSVARDRRGSAQAVSALAGPVHPQERQQPLSPCSAPPHRQPQSPIEKGVVPNSRRDTSDSRMRPRLIVSQARRTAEARTNCCVVKEPQCVAHDRGDAAAGVRVAAGGEASVKREECSQGKIGFRLAAARWKPEQVHEPAFGVPAGPRRMPPRAG